MNYTTTRDRMISRLKSYTALVAPSLAAVVLTFSSPTANADVTVSSGTAVLTTVSLADGETLTVEKGGEVNETTMSGVVDAVDGTTIHVINAGSITGNQSGIRSLASTLTLSNSGSITGTNTNGVSGTDITNLINSGVISGSSRGISASEITNLSNSGMIDGGLDGISVLDIVDFSNSGTIQGGLHGIRATVTVANLINHGTISGGGGDGIEGNGATITNLINTGSITGGAYGVDAISLANLNNSGTITGGTQGINISGGAGASTITNSGTIDGSSGYSIILSGAEADTINLEPGSILIGGFYLVGAADTVNFGAGLSTIVSLGNNEPGTTNFGSPVNYSDAGTRAQADVSTQSVMGDVLLGVTSSIGNGAQTRIDAASFGGTSTGFGYGTEDNVVGKTGTYWVSGWGTASRTKASSSFATTTHVAGGGLVGADWFDENGDLYGVYGGAGVGRIRVDVKNGQETDTNSFYGGIYGKRQMGEGAITLDLLAGWMNFDSKRIVGMATATAKYNGFFFAPTLGYEKDITLGEQQMLASASVGYSGLYLGGYSETGSAGNLTVASRNIHQLNARGELAWQKEIGSGSEHVTKIQPYLGLEGSVGFGGNNATATFLGATTTFKAANSNSVARGFVGAKFNTAMSENSSVFGRLEASYDTGSTAQIGGKIGFAVKF
ncbi:autotransporter outer membrane beta-barrel domain-containing protein [Lentilitoribacter sp. Alg239-R112]|uniref:autotransporter family protein n=1 Tax=Lentilitoribacter sp. Alg239-R112 TaxID=2305987 RepID=UPI0013A68C6A|nr:autotransporter outer membrane beta-barrel domain-containing protein [Lentilitoribacter sp. Alg239-R112]